VIDNNNNVLGKGFDRITAFYDVMACFFSFNQINKSQLAFLSELSSQNTALILGGGTGLFLQKLLQENKEIHITYVDASSKMIEFSIDRIQKNIPDSLQRVTFICAGVEDLEWKSYDLIVCNYIFDLFDNNFVKTLSEKIKQNLNSHGLLYVTDFHISENNTVLKWATKIGLKVLYAFFRWATQLDTKQLPNTDSILKAQGFYIFKSKAFLNGILMCRLYKFNY
jgi:ubiquinone/menaquinone biosynthesis C-methylase UbiE